MVGRREMVGWKGMALGGKGPTAEMVGKNEGKSIAGKDNIGNGAVVAYYIRMELVLPIDLTWCRVL
jgi:hypothetical protein